MRIFLALLCCLEYPHFHLADYECRESAKRRDFGNIQKLSLTEEVRELLAEAFHVRKCGSAEVRKCGSAEVRSASAENCDEAAVRAVLGRDVRSSAHKA